MCGLPVSSETLARRVDRVQLLHYLVCMGTLLRVGKFRVAMHVNDHNPAHVHVSGPDFELLVFLDDLTVEGTAAEARAAADALAWIEAHRLELLERWAREHA